MKNVNPHMLNRLNKLSSRTPLEEVSYAMTMQMIYGSINLMEKESLIQLLNVSV